jgi:hypothetical protein
MHFRVIPPAAPELSKGIRLFSVTFIAGISGATIPTGVAVTVDADGHLGTTTSSARFKDQIKPMDKASEAILALKPVTFRYKADLDPEGIPQFGLVAEQVERSTTIWSRVMLTASLTACVTRQ